MDKTQPRGRRNGTNLESDPATVNGAVGNATAQAARQRLESSPAIAASPIASIPALQDALLDERNDVLAVINELEDQLDRNQEIREGLERELTNTTEKLQNAQTRVQEFEWQVVTLQTRVDALDQVRQQVSTLEEEVHDATARTQRLSEQLATAEKDKEQLRNDLKAANKQLDELFGVRKERDGLRTDYRSLSVKVEELERAQRQMFEERGQLQSQLQEALANVEGVTAERNQVQMVLRNTEDRVRELVQVQDALVERVDALRGEKQNIQAQTQHLERENARLIEQRQFYECEITSLRNRARSAEAALQSVKKAFGEVRVALADTKARARRHGVDAWPRIGTAMQAANMAQGVIAQAVADASSLTAPGMSGAEVAAPQMTADALEPTEST